MKPPCVDVLASERNGTLHVGVTSDLLRRVWEHKRGAMPRFTGKYAVHRRVWFEQHTSMPDAIVRLKRLNTWHRAWKLRLIEGTSPQWHDLCDDLVGFAGTT